MGSSTDFLLGDDLDATSSLIEPDSFNQSPECASMVTKTFSEMYSEKLETHSCTECSKHVRVHKHNKNKLHTFDYEAILLKSNLKDLVRQR